MIDELMRFVKNEMDCNSVFKFDVGCMNRVKRDKEILSCLKKLEAYRKAWDKVYSEIDDYIKSHGRYASAKTALYILDKYRPKESDINEDGN